VPHDKILQLDGATVQPPPKGLSEAFAFWASQDKRRPLLDTPGAQVTAGQLLDLRDRWSASIRSRRLASASILGLWTAEPLGFLAGLLAILAAGHSPLLLDPKEPRRRVIQTANTLRAAAVLRTDGEHLELDPCDSDPARLSAPALIKLSSGSTGAPHGIVCSEQAVIDDALRLAAVMELDASDRMLANIPLGHSYGLSVLALPCLLLGSTLVVPRRGSEFETAAAKGVTFFPSVPPFLRNLVDRESAPVTPKTLRRVLSAGAALAPETARRFRWQFGVPVHAFYGASEIGGITYDPTGTAAETGTVGRPIPGVEIRLEPCPGMESGQGLVTVRSSSLARECLPATDRSQLASGWYRSSDVAEWDDQDLRLLGRATEIVNVGGLKVWPGEVEQVLRRMPSVTAAFVQGRPAPDGETEDLHAVLECATPPSYREARQWCLDALAPHKIPRRIVFVAAMPCTERGKLDRKALGRLLDS